MEGELLRGAWYAPSIPDPGRPDAPPPPMFGIICCCSNRLCRPWTPPVDPWCAGAPWGRFGEEGRGRPAPEAVALPWCAEDEEGAWSLRKAAAAGERVKEGKRRKMRLGRFWLRRMGLSVGPGLCSGDTGLYSDKGGRDGRRNVLGCDNAGLHSLYCVALYCTVLYLLHCTVLYCPELHTLQELRVLMNTYTVHCNTARLSRCTSAFQDPPGHTIPGRDGCALQNMCAVQCTVQCDTAHSGCTFDYRRSPWAFHTLQRWECSPQSGVQC